MGLVAKAFQDIITFSRASSGTYVNSNGYITNSSVLNYLTQSNAPENAAWTKSNSFVQQNLQTYSQDFSNAAWGKVSAGTGLLPVVTADQAIAPDGTLTADLITLNLGGGTTLTDQSNLLGTVATTTTSAPYNGSIYVIAATAADVGKIIVFRHVNNSAYSAITLTASWQRFSVNETAAGATGTISFGLRGATGSSTGSVSFYAWGAQLVQGSVPGDYRATTSAALPCLYADYNGALRARKLCENDAVTQAHRIQQVANLSGTSITLSQRIKAGERTWAYLRIDDAVSSKFAYFNLSAGTTGFATSPLTSTITNVGGGWYLCTATFANPSATASGTGVVGVATGDGVNAYNGDGSSGIYIADAQLNDGSSALAYYDTTASAYNAPRFDYDPVTLAAKGLLVEEQRTNLLVRSNDWSATWNLINITQTPAQSIGPDGTMSMTKIAATATAVTLCAQGSVATSTSQTYSVYAKQGSGPTDANYFAVYNNTTSTSLAILSINYATGVITQAIGTGAYAQNAGNGIWRIVIPITSGITVGNTVAGYFGFVGGAETAGESAYAYGAQMEAGTFATSYIPTVASQVTRAADVASVNTLSPWFNAAQGTLYAEAVNFVPDADSTVRVLAALTDTVSLTNAVRLERVTNLWRDVQTVAGVASVASGTWTFGTNGKIVGAYQSSNSAATFNGATPTAVGTATMPSGIAALGIGCNTSTGNSWNGWIRRITYYPRRLTNAELQTLTTL